MPLVLLAVLLLPSIFDAVLSQSSNYSYSIQNCDPEPSLSQIGEYQYGPGIPDGEVPILCPLSGSFPNIRWSYNLSGPVSVFSDQPFSPDEICVSTIQARLFFLKNFTSNNSTSSGYVSLLVNGTRLDVRYALLGIIQVEPLNNTLLLDEGQPSTKLIFLSYNGQSNVMSPYLYKVSATGDLTDITNNNSSRVVSVIGLVDIKNYCASGMANTPNPKPFGVDIRNPSVADSGTYAVIVTIDGVNYTTNFTIDVSPVVTTISPSPTTTDSVIMSSSVVSTNDSSVTISMTGSTVSPSVHTTITVSPSPTEETSGISLIVYVFCGLLAFLGIVVLIIFVIVVVSCYAKVKSGRVSEPLAAPNAVQYLGDDEVKIGGVTGVPGIAESGRTESNSSTKPLVHSRLSSTSSTPSTKQEDYTAVYCDKRHAVIGEKWKNKLSNKCVLLQSDNDILASLENSSCCEIFVYADPRDPVFVATISRGSPRGREKLKWWQFVDHDKTPEHSIEIEGFKIVQVEGDPHDFSTLQLGMLKTDYPTLNHSNGVLYEDRTPNGHTYSNLGAASYPEDNDSEKKKLKEEIDGLASNDGGSATDAIKELVQEQKITNKYLKEIKKHTEKTANNTGQIADTEQSILGLHEENLVGINEASV